MARTFATHDQRNSRCVRALALARGRQQRVGRDIDSPTQPILRIALENLLRDRPVHHLHRVDSFRDPEIDRFVEELLSAESACELLVGMHQVVGRALATAYRHHIDDTDPLTDVPTIRCLRRILTDYEPMLDWAEGAIGAYIEGGVSEPGLAVWRWHLQGCSLRSAA